MRGFEAWAKRFVVSPESLEAEEARRIADERRAAAELAATSIEYLKACGVGSIEAAPIAAGVEATEAWYAMVEFVASDKIALLLLGGAGSGKTVASCGALLWARRRVVRHDGDGLFVTSDRLARASYFDAGFYDSLCSERMLVVDDVGVEQASSTYAATLDGLVNERVRNGRRTVLTTNLSKAAFAARFAPAGSRLASRLFGYGMSRDVGNADLRRNS